MTQARKVPDDRLIELVRAGRGTWRHSALGAAISYTFGCHPRYARTVIAKAVERGIVVKDDVFYRLPEPARPSTTPRQSKPAGFAHPPMTPSQVNRGTGHWHHLNRRLLLETLRGRSLKSGQIEAIGMDMFGSCDNSVRITLKYALAYGYLARDSKRRYTVTPLAEEQLDRYGQLEGVEGVAFARFCAGKPGRMLGKSRIPATKGNPRLG